MKINIRTILCFIQLAICSVSVLHILISSNTPGYSEEKQTFQISVKTIKKVTIDSSLRPPIISNCVHKYKVAFTFDDGPHPTYTSLIVQTLNQYHIRAGFFILGTSMQSFLSVNNNLSVHQFERPRIGYLLLQDYSLIENLFEGHDIYLHGWLHEKINEMRLQTVVDNISTQLVEIGLLKGFKPIYRAPWGIGTAPGSVTNKAILSQILNQMGVLPAHWNIDTKDYLIKIDEHNITNHILQMICKTKGGLILMHDNRPTTAYFLDRIIRSIRASGHTIVSPAEINRQWDNQTYINRTRKYIKFLRERVNTLQESLVSVPSNRNARLVQISLPSNNRQGNILQSIDANTRYKGIVEVLPNINDFQFNSNNKKVIEKITIKSNVILIH